MDWVCGTLAKAETRMDITQDYCRRLREEVGTTKEPVFFLN